MNNLITKVILLTMLIIFVIGCAGQRFVSFNNKLVEIENKLNVKIEETFKKSPSNPEEYKKLLGETKDEIEKAIKESDKLEAPEEGKEFKTAYIKYFNKLKDAVTKLGEVEGLDENALNAFKASFESSAKELQDVQKELAKKYNVKIQE